MKSMRRGLLVHLHAGLVRVPATWIVVLALTAASISGCRSVDERPDVLLVTIDTLRSDHCSAYGYPVPTTPNLDALAARGVLWRRAYAESSTTAPSHAVLMTGRHFRTLGVTKNGAVVPPDAVTLAEALGGAGYATAAFVSSFPLVAKFGFAQGFEVYDEAFVAEDGWGRRSNPRALVHDRRAGETMAHVQRWLARRQDPRPLFMWVHFVDPHAPYRAPEKFDAAWPAGTTPALRRYDAEVHYADRQLGRLLELLEGHTPRRENFVVVTSDHGEGLGDHDFMYHGVNLHEEAVRVPLVASWPGSLAEGEVADHPVALVDVAAGMLGRLGIDATPFAHGRDLFGPADPSRSIFLQRYDYQGGPDVVPKLDREMTAVVENGSKLIVAPGEQRRELYDLTRDAREQRDLLAASTAAEATARAMDGALADWRRAFPAVPPNLAIDKQDSNALRALGYAD